MNVPAAPTARVPAPAPAAPPPARARGGLTLQNLGQIKYHDEHGGVVETVISFVRNRPKPFLLIQGCRGCGKVTAVRTAARRMNRKLIVITNESAHDLDTTLVSRNSVPGHRPVPAILVLRGVNEWPAVEQTRARKLLGRVMTHHAVVVTCGDPYWVNRRAWEQPAQCLKLRKPSVTWMQNVLRQVVKMMGYPPLNHATVRALTEPMDMRFMFCQLVLTLRAPSTLLSVCDPSSQLDYFTGLCPGLFTTAFADRKDSVRTHNLLIPCIRANYLHANTRESQILDISDTLSLLDRDMAWLELGPQTFPYVSEIVNRTVAPRPRGRGRWNFAAGLSSHRAQKERHDVLRNSDMSRKHMGRALDVLTTLQLLPEKRYPMLQGEPTRLSRAARTLFKMKV